MKRKLFILSMSTFLLFGCGQNVMEDGFSVLQPGHFCRLEAVEVKGDTVFVAGSFVAEENPNVSVQAVYGYAAALDGDGKLLWEYKPQEPDYIRWKCLDVDKISGNIFLSGERESPMEGGGYKGLELDIKDGTPIGPITEITTLLCEDAGPGYAMPSAPEQVVNQSITADDGSAWIVTTAKNAQGPCLWRKKENDTALDSVCLPYWPFHLSTLLLRQGKCAVTVFNAADERNEHSAHVVMINERLETLWQQTIGSDHPFIINAATISGKSLYLGGTWEMGGEGSAMVVKVLELPTCQ